ncbi:MAG: hypothetical protein JXQ89_23175, partial [Pelagimonas sp.]
PLHKWGDYPLATALQQMEELLGQPLAITPRLDVIDDSSFWALIELQAEDLCIRASTGVASTLAAFWDAAYASKTFLGGAGRPVTANKDDMLHLSLVWLMLHELQHFDLNHFDLMGCPFVGETAQSHQFAIASRAPAKPNPLPDFPISDLPKVPLCLELQADHDASELLLDAYSADEWESLRYRAMAISAVMMLIEQEDATNTAPLSTHPKAATRIFQLLGHITEMPLIPAQRIAIINGYDAIDPNDLPSNEEQTAYGKEVSIPCFFDAVNLAQIAGADSIRQDLGEAQDFFADVGIAKAADPEGFDAFKTNGARQWADLVLFNETLKTYQTLPDGLT